MHIWKVEIGLLVIWVITFLSNIFFIWWHSNENGSIINSSIFFYFLCLCIYLYFFKFHFCTFISMWLEHSNHFHQNCVPYYLMLLLMIINRAAFAKKMVFSFSRQSKLRHNYCSTVSIWYVSCQSFLIRLLIFTRRNFFGMDSTIWHDSVLSVAHKIPFDCYLFGLFIYDRKVDIPFSNHISSDQIEWIVKLLVYLILCAFQMNFDPLIHVVGNGLDN